MRTTLLAIALAALQGCAAITTHELYDGIAAERQLDGMEIIIERVPNPDLRCRELIRAAGGTPIPWGLGFYGACANLPFDAQLAPGQRPWCRIVIWEDEPEDSRTLRHELEHCQGYRDAFIGTSYGG